MFTNKMKKAAAVLAVFAGAITMALPAQARSYSLSLDPDFGFPFPDLGWTATALFDASAGCEALGTGSFTSGACTTSGGITFSSVTVNFYNKAAPATILESFDVTPGTASVSKVVLNGGTVTGLTAGPFPFFTPSGDSFTIAGEGGYSFALLIGVGSIVDGVQVSNGKLYYSTNNPLQGLDCLASDDPETCGLSEAPAKGVITLVPEPQTYALMLAGLCAVGFMARRRRIG